MLITVEIFYSFFFVRMIVPVSGLRDQPGLFIDDRLPLESVELLPSTSGAIR